MTGVERIQREGYHLANGCQYHYRRLACGVETPDDPTGRWTTLHSQWHVNLQAAGPDLGGDR